MLTDYLNELLDKYRPLLKEEAGEVQICYLLMQREIAKDKYEYIVMICAMSEDNRMTRALYSIRMEDAISNILKQMPNA